MAGRVKYTRTASCRYGLHPELGRQPLNALDQHPLVNQRLTGGLTEAEEGQVDGPPTDEGPESRDADKPPLDPNS